MLFNNSLNFLHKMLRFDSGRKNLNSRPKSHLAFFHMVLNSRNSWEHNGISCINDSVSSPSPESFKVSLRATGEKKTNYVPALIY